MDCDVYILITRSKTCFSRLIHLATAAPYTHVSIGLDGLDGDFYSFSRKYARLALPAGMVREGIDGGEAIPYRLYRLRVSPKAYSRIREHLEDMYCCRACYRFNLLGALAAFFHFPLPRRGRYFCSQFVAETLQNCGALELGKNPALVRPIDFCHITGLHLVSEGFIGRLGSGRSFPAPSEVVSILPFGRNFLRAYRSRRWSR